MIKMKKTCKDCRYFDKIKDPRVQLSGTGFCRRNAPRTSHSKVLEMYGLWPVVGKDDWCGELTEAD